MKPRRVTISAWESLTVWPSRLICGPVMQRLPEIRSVKVAELLDILDDTIHYFASDAPLSPKFCTVSTYLSQD